MVCVAVTTEGEVCVFPFIAMKKSYTDCTTDQRTDGRKWCSTSANYDTDRKWGFCTEGDKDTLEEHLGIQPLNALKMKKCF